MFGLFGQKNFAQIFNKAKMDSLIDIIAAKNKAMLSIALSYEGKVVYSKAIGYSEISTANKTPSTTLTQYRIGSITKIFTSVMIFQLIEEGKLNLSTKLAAYFPKLPNAERITIANLLSHSSGLHNFTNDSSYSAMLNQKVSRAAMLSKFLTQKPDFIPGEKHKYSNTNFILLGYILENIDHKTYAEALKDRILKKIGLKQTYHGGKINPAHGEALSYKWENGWLPDTETDMSIPGGAGALVSTPTDLVKFMTELFNGKLISKNSLKYMTTMEGGYGMDLVSYAFDTKIGYGHDGGIDGFQSQAVYYPQEKLATAFTANGVNVSLNKVMAGVLSIYFNKPYKLPTFTPMPLQPNILEKYTGTYASKDVSYKVLFTQDSTGTALVLKFSDGQEKLLLEADSPDTFSYDPYDVTFVFDPVTKRLNMRSGRKALVFNKEVN